MRDAGPKSDHFRPMSPRAYKGYVTLFVASTAALLFGVLYGLDLMPSGPNGDREQWLRTLIFLGMLGQCHVFAVLFRHVATLSREIAWLKEQSPNKPAEISLTS